MMPPAEIALFRSIRKTAIVLLLLLKLDRPISMLKIASILDMDHKTVSSYLRSLSQLNIIANTSDGWVLTQGGSQFVLSSEGVGDFPMLTTATTTIGRSNHSQAEVAEEGVGISPIPLDQRCEKAMATLADYGVSGTKMIINLVQSKDYITAEYVERSAERLEKEKRFSTPLLITVLRCGDPLPMTAEEKHRRSFEKYYREFNQ